MIALRTNLMATGWFERRFVPMDIHDMSTGGCELDRVYVPSKTTPKEPSPIFLPTRKWLPTMPFDEPDWDGCADDEAITWGVAIGSEKGMGWGEWW